KKPEGYFLSLAVQVSALPGTHTYRLFCLLKSGAAFVAAAEEVNYTPRHSLRQHIILKTSAKWLVNFITHCLL
ncbi:hypothetical protein, partial [Paludibacterium purpuratum]|uniref:hypothetical protein n=1 Tax=Paludibacterium purpuratum TaxID=1144873 RepID=UPI001AACB12D